MIEEKNLSELIFESNYKPVVHVENVKEKIQKVQGRLKIGIDEIRSQVGKSILDDYEKIIDKIFKEEFGKRLIWKNKLYSATLVKCQNKRGRWLHEWFSVFRVWQPYKNLPADLK